MYVVKNALANLIRNRGRNLILGGMMALILFSSTVAIMIYNAADNQIKAYTDQFSASVILYRNNEKLKNISHYQEPSWEELQKYAQSSLLKSTEFIGSVPASLPEAEALDENSTEVSGFDSENLPGIHTAKPSTNLVFGTNNQEINGEFKNGIRKLIAGRLFQQPNEILVSQPLAELNGWNCNDEVTLSFPNPAGSPSRVNMKIVGIYEDGVQPYESEDLKLPLIHRGNEIMTSLDTLSVLESPLVNITANYRIKNPAQIAELEKEFHEMGLPEYFGLKTDQSGYQKQIAPLQSLKKMTSLFLIGVLILGGGILIVISTMAIRERIYEVGILRAMGMKKHVLAAGLLCEILVMTGLCLILSFFGARAASEPIANQLFQSHKQAVVNTLDPADGTEYSAIGGFSDSSSASQQPLTVEVTGIVMGEVVIASILFAALSSVGGLYYSMRYEPQRILSERT